MAQKSPDAYRTIGEAAQAVGVPPHVLRFWESRFSQIKPMKRGGGRRYFRPADIKLLCGIRGLLYDEGLSIRQVQGRLRESGVASVALAAMPEECGGQDVTSPESMTGTVAAETTPELSEERQAGLQTALEELLAAHERLNQALQKH